MQVKVSQFWELRKTFTPAHVSRRLLTLLWLDTGAQGAVVYGQAVLGVYVSPLPPSYSHPEDMRGSVVFGKLTQSPAMVHSLTRQGDVNCIVPLYLISEKLVLLENLLPLLLLQEPVGE